MHPDPKDRFVRVAGPLAVSAGCLLAVLAAAVIVLCAPATSSAPKAAPAVRLDPVIVTISRERFDALRAEPEAPLMAGRVRQKPREG